MSRIKNLYRETYRGAKLHDSVLPVLKHLEVEAEVTGAELLAQGVVQKDGLEQQYQDIRVFVRVKGD
jgi:hypothetical protein